jgi:hypothetical protein
MAKALAKYHLVQYGMRTAFDRIDEDGKFQDMVAMLNKHGVSSSNIIACLLFNFTDHPKEADYRARECLRLGVDPYPQQYQPALLTKTRRSFISKKWTKGLCKAFFKFWTFGGLFRRRTFEDYIYKEGKFVWKLQPTDYEKWEDSGGVNYK